MESKSSPFYEKVYQIVRQIPRGKVTSYGRIAVMLDSPGWARQVGYAMSALKEKSKHDAYADIPWQRVINSQGYISIKGSGKGKIMQAELLREEGVDVTENFRVDLKMFLWDGLMPHEINELLK